MTIEIATKRQDNARAADKEQTAGVGRNPPWRLPASRALYQTRACVIARTTKCRLYDRYQMYSKNKPSVHINKALNRKWNYHSPKCGELARELRSLVEHDHRNY